MVIETQAKIGGFNAWVNWTLSASFVVLEITLLTGYAVTNVYVSRDLSLTIAQMGLVGMVYTWVFAITQIVTGSILDRFGTRWTLPIACLIVSIGAFLFASSADFKMLVVANILSAIGSSFGFIGAGFVGGQWFEPKKYGFMFALVQFIAALSAVICQKVYGILIVDVPWSQLISGLGFMGIAIFLLMVFFLREPEGVRLDNNKWDGLKFFIKTIQESLLKVASIRDTWINAMIGGITMGSMLGLGVIWGPRVLIAGGMEPGEAFTTNSLAWLGLAFGSPFFAWLSDAFKSRIKPMAAGCALQMLTILLIIGYLKITSLNFSVLFFIFGFMAGGSMLPFTIGSELVPFSLIGTSAAFVNATQFIFGGIMMVVPGKILNGNGVVARINEKANGVEIPSIINTLPDFQWALSIMPISLVVALFLCLFLQETSYFNKEEEKSYS
jgi:MFS family permease